jgi:hypothetical protein
MIKMIMTQRCKIGHMANTKSPTWPMYGENDCCIMAASPGSSGLGLRKLPLDKTGHLGYNLT